MISRAGMLDKAENYIMSLENQDVNCWQALLGACNIHGDVERAKRVAEKIWKLKPQDSSTLVLMANTFAAAGRWDEHFNMWTEMKSQNIKKNPGATWVSVNGKTETFHMDSCHSYLLF